MATDPKHQNETPSMGAAKLVVGHDQLDGQRRFLNAMFAGFNELIYLVDRQKRFVFMNKALQQLQGVAEPQYVGKPVSFIIPSAELAQQVEQHIETVFQTGQTVIHETQATSLTGKTGFYEYVFNPVVAVNGEVEFVAGISRDITERKRRELHMAFLAEVSDVFAGLSAPDQIMNAVGEKLFHYIGTSRLTFSTVDEAADTITAIYEKREPEFTKTAMEPQPLSTYFSDAYQRELKAGRVIAINNIRTDSRTAAQADAYAVWGVSAQLHAPFTSKGTWCFIITVNKAQPYEWLADEIDLLQELSSRLYLRLKRAQAEEALSQSAERTRIAVEAAEMATWEWHLFSDQVYWNEQHFRLLGLPVQVEPVSPNLFLSHIHPDEREAVTSVLSKAIDQKSTYEAIFRIVRQDGVIRWMSGYGRVTDTNEGRASRMNGVMYDITDRKQAEEAQKLADRRKDEFLAMLAHELRNPLAPISNILQILLLTIGHDETVNPMLLIMNRQVDHLVRLVDDLLDVSRISRGSIRLRWERIELSALVKQAVDAALPTYQDRHRQLQLTLPPARIYINGDAARLNQVVMNLLTNGVRYTSENGQVWVSLEQAQGKAILRVRDNGIGLTVDQMSVIFDLFVQVDNSLARPLGGLGVGLTLVQKLVEQHGGRVEVASRGLGQGSEFIVYLPVLQEQEKSTYKVKESSSSMESGYRILVVDDNQDAAMTLSMLLKLKGYEVHTRFTGEEAVTAFTTLRPPVVLLDIGMPDLDGYETCRLIRRQAGGHDAVLIALTGYGQEEDKQRSLAAGFNGHLVKPVDLVALIQMLTTLVTPGQIDQ